MSNIGLGTQSRARVPRRLMFLIWAEIGDCQPSQCILCFFRAWSRFKLDMDLPLGADDQQAICLTSRVHILAVLLEAGVGPV
jgi:hypothetical protein